MAIIVDLNQFCVATNRILTQECTLILLGVIAIPKRVVTTMIEV